MAYPLATPLLWPPCIFFTFKVLGALASRRGSPSWAKYAGFVAWNLAGSMLLLSIVAAVVPWGEGAIAPAMCFLAVVGPWMVAAYAGALAVLVRFVIGLREE
jgi:hypothetical protein